MLKRLILLITAAFCFPVNTVHPEEAVKILILPYEIHGPDEFDYLKTEIPKVIQQQLKEDGAVILTPGSDSEAILRTMERNQAVLREIGTREGADFVIWGSFTWTDLKFRLDANLMTSLGESAPEILEQEGEGIETLLVAVTVLSRNISDKILKLKKIMDIKIIGNERIDSDTIKGVIQSSPGMIYLAERVPEDIKAIYAMGYFDDIHAAVEDVPGGKSIAFTVKEKPTIRLVMINGNNAFDDDRIMEEIDISEGSILNTLKIEASIDAIRELYNSKNYHDAEITYSVRSLKNHQADLIFDIKEGKKIFVHSILFEGNVDFSDDELQHVMKTSEKGSFSWLTSSGDLKHEDLEEDIMRLRAHYHNTGYISAEVHEPEIEYTDDGISITIAIDEGDRYKVGQVDIVGDLIEIKSEMMRRIHIANEEFYNREIMQNDVIILTDLYADAGYAYAEITPRIQQIDERKLVDIAYEINRGKQVYFEKINITGNTKTKDKVIRRELKLEEQGVFSGTALKQSIRNLHRLGLFESDIDVETSKGSADDKMVLDISVKERSTTSFNFSGAYSAYEGTYIGGWYEERNFLGRGSDLRVGISMGGISDSYYLRYIEPWLFDIPLTGGTEIYQQDIDYFTYNLHYRGFFLGVNYPIHEFIRVYLSYRYDVSELDNFTLYVPDSVLGLETSNVSNSVSTAIRYDSRDRYFDPTEGAMHALTLEYAGFSGNIGFLKTELESGYYVPIRNRLTGFLRGRGGFVKEISGKLLPDYERFYLGGINSMRGFDYLSIGVETKNSFGFTTVVGGNKYVLLNLEMLYTLVEDSGMVFVLFYDTGNVFDDHEHIDFGGLRHCAGFGFRFYSPLGLIRIENGYILDPKPGEDSTGKWVFTIGSMF